MTAYMMRIDKHGGEFDYIVFAKKSKAENFRKEMMKLGFKKSEIDIREIKDSILLCHNDYGKIDVIKRFTNSDIKDIKNNINSIRKELKTECVDENGKFDKVFFDDEYYDKIREEFDMSF